MIFIRRYFPFLVIPPAIVFAMMMAGGCSSTTTVSTDEHSINMQSQLTTSTVSAAAPGKDNQIPSGLTFSSIVVTKTEMFLKDIKLHSDKDDSVKDDHDGEIKTGPAVLIFDSTGVHSVLTTTIPAGDYDHVKFEFHKPDKNANSDDAALLQTYPEFQVGNQTYTVVIFGYTTDATGLKSYFTAYSSASKNVTLKFEDGDKDKGFKDQDKLTFSGGGSSILLFEFDPRIVFRTNIDMTGSLLDPRGVLLDDHILASIRVVRE